MTTKISEDTQEEDSTHDEHDQDSSISFDDDDWIEDKRKKHERS